MGAGDAYGYAVHAGYGSKREALGRTDDSGQLHIPGGHAEEALLPALHRERTRDQGEEDHLPRADGEGYQGASREQRRTARCLCRG